MPAQFETFSAIECMPIATEMLTACIATLKPDKEDDKNASKKELLTAEQYVLMAKRVGISVLELKYFEVGDVLDVALECVKDLRCSGRTA